MSDDPVAIDPDARPCACYGAPINPVWLTPTTRRRVGYACGQCGHRWPIAALQRRAGEDAPAPPQPPRAPVPPQPSFSEWLDRVFERKDPHR